ncbi:hypothetical protein Hanom_Chr01g00037331 [Helianthus anomalus]
MKKEKVVSLEIDLEVEKQKAESAVEVRKVSQAALDVAQDNYAEVQSVVELLVNNSEWLRQYGIAHVANAVLNSVELHQTVAALTVAVATWVIAKGAWNVQLMLAALKMKWYTSHCFVNAEVEKGFA